MHEGFFFCPRSLHGPLQTAAGKVKKRARWQRLAQPAELLAAIRLSISLPAPGLIRRAPAGSVQVVSGVSVAAVQRSLRFLGGLQRAAAKIVAGLWKTAKSASV